MNAYEIHKYVIHPDFREHEARIVEAIRILGPQHITTKTWLKMKLGRYLHPFGVHTWVTWKTYDVMSDRVIDTGGKVCEFCPKGKYRR